MTTHKWIFLLALSFRFVSSNDEPLYGDFCGSYDDLFCEVHVLVAPLGSSVFLPCIFKRSNISWVTWTYENPQQELVRLSSEGRITFQDPRYGRVKAFPNQASVENYTIRIDELENSDLGCYRCQPDVCFSVQLPAEKGGGLMLLIIISIGLSALILLVVGVYFCVKCIVCRNKTGDTASIAVIAGTGPSAPPVQIVAVTAHPPQRGQDNQVYENDDQGPSNASRPQSSGSGLYPNLNQFTFERVESQRTRQRFHIELFSRLRQASARHFYVNQSELNKQQPMSKQNQHTAGLERRKKTNENFEYKNPIYNSSTEQLHRT
ncbi:uncharacterized protein LOC114444871 [Parambassis ranga]|uniref:Uncharacterized protein LOC114444871 n=1 Tax=Parambassis ranga TaxID=210632 RepID=A0A6P7JFN2_9TELE|nr:uncharacterized protein LOC114444871 [Parambassis ranga]